MAKLATAQTLSPDLFGVGQAILTPDIQAIAAAQGYSVGNVRPTFVARQGYLNLPATQPALLRGAGVVVISHELWVPAHVQALELQVEIELGAASTATAEVSVTIGGAGAVVFSRAGVAGAQPAAQAVLTSATGTGDVLCEISGEVTAGTDAEAALGAWRIGMAAIAAVDLPSPSFE